MDRHTFGKRLRQCRETLGLTQADFANRCGLYPAAVSFFETGVRLPGLANLVAVANAANVSIDFLVGRKDVPEPISEGLDCIVACFAAMRAEDQEFLLSMARNLAERSQSPFVNV